MPKTDSKVQVAFPHGLGDCTMFAHQIPLYTRRGIEVEVACNPDKHILFAGTGARLVPITAEIPKFGWNHPHAATPASEKSLACWNKAAWNFSTSPMPDIGRPEELWDEYCAQRIEVLGHVGENVKDEVRKFLAPLPRPVVLLHTIGNSFQGAKSLQNEATSRLYDELLDRTDGTLVLLDWDKRVPRLNHFRVRHLTDDWARINVEHLLVLLDRSDLIIGIDSGPLHAARYTDTPALGVFWNAGHHPTRYCLPRDGQACIVPEKMHPELTERSRREYHIIASRGDSVDPAFIATHAQRILEGTRYLKQHQIAADVQLQQMVRDWSRGNGNAVSRRVDRDRGWDAILGECGQRFDQPVMVETGCIRSKNDWRGAGNSTVLLGEYALRTGGILFSADVTEKHCDLARQATRMLPCVKIVCTDSVAFLAGFGRSIDLLYLDSMDTFVTGSPEHALKESQAAMPWLHKNTIVVFDDTAWSCGRFIGKGAHAVPWLLGNGWRILFSGYQTVLVRA